MLKKLKNYFCKFVIADPRDNSITFSRALYREIERNGLGNAKVLVVRIRKTGEYAFTVNPSLDGSKTQLADIQYNAKHHSIGFEALVPTINRIFYDYKLPHDAAFRIKVKKESNPLVTYYIMKRV